MCPRFTEELPEGVREAGPAEEDSALIGDEFPVQTETLGNGWLLVGIFLMIAIGVLMLLIFASGGNADSSMML